MEKTAESIWEGEIYGQGKYINRWPYDSVVSFVFRHFPKDRPRNQVRILEIGCGTGNNVWFAAMEGFAASGIDVSATAIKYAQARLKKDNLSADLRVGSFAELPYADNAFDLAIDRGSLSCVGRTLARRAVEEVRRVLKPNGKFLSNPYSDRHTDMLSGKPGPDGLTIDIADTAVPCGQYCFYGRAQVESLFAAGWQLASLEHIESRHELPPYNAIATWRAVAEKK